MREIKFRAWVGTHKLMFQVREMIIPDGLNEAGFQEIAVTDNYSIVRPMHYIQPILMQYTGLEDKNGKEIYEGDIVTIPGQYPYFDCDTPNYVAEVEWIFAGFQTVLHCINGKKRGISEGINEPLEDGTYFEVIGNIYENPELLKQIVQQLQYL